MVVQHTDLLNLLLVKGNKKMVIVLLEEFISKVKSNDLGSWDAPIDLGDYIDNYFIASNHSEYFIAYK